MLIASLFFSKNRKMRWSVAGFLALFVVFYVLISPSNLRYLKNSLFVPKKQEQELIAYEKKAVLLPQKEGLEKAAADEKKAVYAAAKVDILLSQPLLAVPDSEITLKGKPGKLVSFKEDGPVS